MTSILLMIKVLVAFLIIFGVVLLTLRNIYWVIYLTMIAFAITTYEWLNNVTLRFSLQIVQLNTIDLLTIYLIIVTLLLNFRSNHKYDYPKIILYSLYLVVIIFALSLCRGFFQNEFALVVEDIRRLLQAFFIPILCYMYIPIELSDSKFRRIIANFTRAIIIFCGICWALDIALDIKIMPPQSDAGSTMRVLRPDQTLVIAMIAIYMVNNDLVRDKLRYISAGSFVLITAVILLQHRSVWMALAAGLIYTAIRCNPISVRNINKKTISTRFLLQLIGLFLCIPILLFLFRSSDLLVELQTGLNGIFAEDSSTLSYRQQLWAAHLSDLNLYGWIIGEPFGSGYLIQLTGYTRDITPHSAYIQTIIRSGLIGVIAVVLFVLATVYVCIKRKCIWGVAVCLMLLVFWYPYSYNFYTAIVFAFVIKSIKYSVNTKTTNV